MTKTVTRKVGRDSGNGQFIPVKEAEHKRTAEVETIRYPKKP
jgi:hypothetical protein